MACCVGHDFSRSAGVARHDLHRRRHDARVLRDGQERHRGKACHEDEYIEHRGEPRVINEEVGDFHRSRLLLFSVGHLLD
jgi:hypothetical protein